MFCFDRLLSWKIYLTWTAYSGVCFLLFFLRHGRSSQFLATLLDGFHSDKLVFFRNLIVERTTEKKKNCTTIMIKRMVLIQISIIWTFAHFFRKKSHLTKKRSMSLVLWHTHFLWTTLEMIMTLVVWLHSAQCTANLESNFRVWCLTKE